MSSSVLQANVLAGHVLFVDTLTHPMPDPQAICGIMPRYAGVARLLIQLMAPKMSKRRVQHYAT